MAQPQDTWLCSCYFSDNRTDIVFIGNIGQILKYRDRDILILPWLHLREKSCECFSFNDESNSSCELFGPGSAHVRSLLFPLPGSDGNDGRKRVATVQKCKFLRNKLMSSQVQSVMLLRFSSRSIIQHQ